MTTLAISGFELSFQLELVFAFVRGYVDGEKKLHTASLLFLCLARLPFVVLGIMLYELEMKLICGGIFSGRTTPVPS